MIKVEINGKELEVPAGKTIIEVADEAGIAIPRFCYHEKLSVAANCRMCLVEVEKAPKPLPACATQLADGMKVFTQSQKALEAQKSVMEFLLINHPLDCPICDQGGECELQDLAMGYGRDISRFTEGKRSVHDLDIGPLVKTEMTRCIHCTRCVRFGEEVAGMRELGATGRGEHTTIGTYLEKSLDSELSGNVIDVCPVGALTSKPFRHTARPWELVQKPTIAPHDCIGSNLFIHSVRNEVKRVIPKENNDINECWISDRDRFSYLSLNNENRLTHPQMKQNGEWRTVSWEQAFDVLSDRLTTAISEHGAESIGAVISPSSTVEEGYLLQKMLRALGSNNIDHRIHQQDFSHNDDMAPLLGTTLNELEEMDAVLVLGGHPRKEQPILNIRLRKASLKGGKISYVNAVKQDVNYTTSEYIAVEGGDFIRPLSGILAALIKLNPEALSETIKNKLVEVEPDQAEVSIAQQLLSGERATIMVGAQVINHQNYYVIKELAKLVSKASGAGFGLITEGANATGLWHAEALPYRHHQADTGKSVSAMFKRPLKAYILQGIEPDIDCAETQGLTKALADANLVVSLSSFTNPFLSEYADLLLPVSAYAENEGTYVNIEGKWQSFEQACRPQEEVKPAWKVYRVLANMLGLESFDYQSVQDVLTEVKSAHMFDSEQISSQPVDEVQVNKILSLGLQKYQSTNEHVTTVSQWPCYAVDATVRNAQELQRTKDAIKAGVYVNSKTAEALGVADNEPIQLDGQAQASSHQLRLVIDDNIPHKSAFIPSGVFCETSLPLSGEPLTLAKV